MLVQKVVGLILGFNQIIELLKGSLLSCHNERREKSLTILLKDEKKDGGGLFHTTFIQL